MSDPNPRLVVLDRDGVINQDSDAYIKAPEEWHCLPGSAEAIARLNQAGFQVAVATNQSGIARGMYDLEVLQAIHAKMDAVLAAAGAHIDYLVFCPHGPDDQCDCRKPRPGLLRQIADHYGRADLKGVASIGDSFRDLEAGMALGADPILVRTGKGERTLRSHHDQLQQIPVYADLAAAVDALLQQD